MWFSPKFNALFVHIPKAAGTAIRWLFDSNDPDVVSYGNHLMLPQASMLVRDQREVFTFSFVRNPFDLMVSLYEYQRRESNPIVEGKTFPEWLRWREPAGRVWTQSQFLTGKVDFLGRFESIEQDISRISEILDLPIRDFKKANETPHAHWSTYYDESDADVVRRLFADDFDRFNYARVVNSE